MLLLGTTDEPYDGDPAAVRGHRRRRAPDPGRGAHSRSTPRLLDPGRVRSRFAGPAGAAAGARRDQPGPPGDDRRPGAGGDGLGGRRQAHHLARDRPPGGRAGAGRHRRLAAAGRPPCRCRARRLRPIAERRLARPGPRLPIDISHAPRPALMGCSALDLLAAGQQSPRAARADPPGRTRHLGAGRVRARPRVGGHRRRRAAAAHHSGLRGLDADDVRRGVERTWAVRAGRREPPTPRLRPPRRQRPPTRTTRWRRSAPPSRWAPT